MFQSLHVLVSINVLHSSSTHCSQVLIFIPFLDLGLIIQIIIAWLNHVWNDQNMPMALNAMISKHVLNSSCLLLLLNTIIILCFNPFMFQIFHMFQVYLLLWTIGYTLMSMFSFLFFNSDKWLNFDNHDLFMFLKPKTWSLHFTP
jgi:hypothetical protein